MDPRGRRRRLVVLLVLLLGVTTACSSVASPGPHTRVEGAAAMPRPAVRAPVTPTTSPPAAPRHRRQAGTDDWRPTRPALLGQVEGFTNPVSGPPGTRVALMASTTAPTLRALAWRIGGYRGGSGRLVWVSRTLKGVQQPPARVLPATRTVVAPWSPVLHIRTRSWRPGFYVIKLVASTGEQALVPYTVSSPSTAGRVALVAPVMDWAAYDDWGGYSLYAAPRGQLRSWAVSFDRPARPPGASQLEFNVVPVVRLAERLGIPLAYETDVDVSTRPGLLRGARAVVTLGHDEYWTPAERQAVMDARHAGTNLAFLSSNDVYWRVRLQRTRTGPARLLVGFKYDAASNDPVRFRDPAAVTGRWRDGVSPEPENTLTGMLYECFPVDTGWRVESPHWWGYRGTGVRRGTTFPHLVRMEADRVYPIAGTPHPLQVLAYSPFSCNGVGTSAESVYYTTRSGAGVVTFGTQWWPCALRRHCQGLPSRDDLFARQVMRNVLRVFARGPAGRRHPAHDNLSRFWLPAADQIPRQ